MQNYPSCANCNYSLHNLKGDLECHFDSPPFEVVHPVNWCGKYDASDSRRHNERKEWYKSELERLDAEKKAEANRKRQETKAKNKASKKGDDASNEAE
ncbi:MAG: hypothetical protein OXG15_08470 [Gammaproteobacteria bacterium]|nr:hypothetical protein [Gammaproteobacteria bacterium]